MEPQKHILFTSSYKRKLRKGKKGNLHVVTMIKEKQKLNDLVSWFPTVSPRFRRQGRRDQTEYVRSTPVWATCMAECRSDVLIK